MVLKDKDRKKDIGEHLYSSRKSLESTQRHGVKNNKSNKGSIIEGGYEYEDA